MKKAFTMIELTLVIVILGILAAVAIPRLAATRDDATAVKAVTDLRTLINDLTTNLASKGFFPKNLNDSTGILLVDKGNGSGVLKVGKEKCYEIKVYDSGSKEITAPINGLTYIDTSKEVDFDYIMISAINTNKKLCKVANNLPEMKSILNNVPIKYKDLDLTSNSTPGNSGFIIVGGSNLYGRKGDRVQN